MPEEPLRITDSGSTVSAPATPYYNPDHRARIEQWVQDHWHHGECPVCQSNDWTTSSVNEIAGFTPIVGAARAILPVFPVFCLVCGYTLWINAVIAKVVRTGEDGLVAIDVETGKASS